MSRSDAPDRRESRDLSVSPGSSEPSDPPKRPGPEEPRNRPTPLPDELADRLLDWYRDDGRELPWRGLEDPYAILVSEVMLQQTRVETVLPRFRSFLDRFPDPESLAAATEEEVLAEWSGLGYYRRARFLHACARQVVEEHGGALPRDPGSLRELPGVGSYTAAAVASIAFGEPELAIDGNVARVLCRLGAIRDDPTRAAVRRRLRELAAPLLERHHPGDANQALMDLGARICTPASPRCLLCPVSTWCGARAAGIQEKIPPSRGSEVREVIEAAAVIESDGAFLLLRGQRPGVLQGMWEFPTLDSRVAAELEAREEEDSSGVPSEDVADLLATRLERFGWPVDGLEPLGEIRHGITSRRIRCRVFRAEPAGARDLFETPESASASGWFEPSEIVELPRAASVRKTAELLEWSLPE